MFYIQDHAKDFDYIMSYVSKRLERIFNCVTWLLTLSNKVEKCLYVWFVCLCVCAHSNCCKYSSNLSVLFISETEWIALEMVCMGPSVHLQRYTKVFRYILAYQKGG